MKILTFKRGTDYYDELSGMIPAVADYFDFPSSMAAFGESLSSSHLCTVDNGDVFFRRLNKNLTLLSYYCSSARLRTILTTLLSDGYKIKSLNYVNKDMTDFLTRRFDDEYWVDQSWDWETVLQDSNNKRKKRKAFRRCEPMYPPEFNPTYDEAMYVFEEWYQAAKLRHFMVVRGHYIRYIQRYFEKPNNVKLIGYRNLDGGMVGIMGYEMFNGDAQITLGKHLIGDYYFPRYFLVCAINAMKADGAKKMYFGSEADDLKVSLRMTADRSYKLVLK